MVEIQSDNRDLQQFQNECNKHPDVLGNMETTRSKSKGKRES